MYPSLKVKEERIDAVYPSLKVKEERIDDCHDGGRHHRRASPRSPLLGLKAIDFLLIHDNPSPEQQHRVVFAECIARIPNIHVSNGATRVNSIDEGQVKDKSSNEDDKPHIRAGSILRPRAVLSSPDNDELIGKNSKATEQSCRRTNDSTSHNRSARSQFAVPIENINARSPERCATPTKANVNNSTTTSKRKPKDTAANGNRKHPKPRTRTQSPSPKVINNRSCARAGKPDILRI